MNVFAAWWRQADHYDWLSGYLLSRRLQTLVRWAIAASTLLLTSITLAMTTSPAGPHRVFGDVGALSAVAWSFGMALLWVWRWPSRWQSAFYAVTVALWTAVVCVSYADPLFGLLGCVAFAVLGGYIASFHTPRLLVVNLVVATATTLVLALRLATETRDVTEAVCGFLLMHAAFGSVPFVAQALVHFLGVDVMSRDVDPLCGLLNRRGFYRHTLALVASPAERRGRCLTVTMVDLDRFKQLNDAAGHLAGDRALVAVGEVLRRTTDNGSVVARVGGEEFLIAEVSVDGQPERGERLRAHIASTPFDITASVGLATRRLGPDAVFDRRGLVELISTADAAMYEAKRAGGDRVCHRWAAEGSADP